MIIMITKTSILMIMTLDDYHDSTSATQPNLIGNDQDDYGDRGDHDHHDNHPDDHNGGNESIDFNPTSCGHDHDQTTWPLSGPL